MAIKNRMTNWDVSWNGASLGTVMKVDPDLKYKLEPIKRGTTGLHILGHFITALEGSVKVQCADIDGALIKRLLPWQAAGEIMPLAPNADLYTYAQPLILHPHDMGEDTSEDLSLVKCAPMTAVKLTREGEKQDVYEVDFQPYPDRDKLLTSPPQVVYGYVGPIPG